MGFSVGTSPSPTFAWGACMRLSCNILVVTRTLCPLSFGAIGSGVPSCRCLVYVGQAPGNGSLRWIKPHPYNCVWCMHALLVQHTRYDKNTLSTKFWSNRIRRSELPLPCVRRQARRLGMGFLVGTSPPPTFAWGACMRLWCNILVVTRTLCPLSFGAIGSGVPSCRCLVYVVRAPGNGIFSLEQAPTLQLRGGHACAFAWCNIKNGP
jgi:hypothetical protein